MKNKLQNYFPIIRTRGEVLEELRENKELWKTFCGWKETCQQEYLDLCTGVKGIKLLYDTYFKAIMNPDTRPDRFNDFISEMLGQRVKVLKVLPNESARIAAESSLLVMDGGRKYCKRRGAEDRVSVPGREKCVLFGGSATETV